MRYIGIDIGASFLKAALLDTEQKPIGRIIKKPMISNFQNANSTQKELDPQILWHQVKDILLKVKGHHDVEGILISNQMHGFIILDENGSPRTGYVTWQDSRGSNPETVIEVSKSLGVDGLRRTGMPLMMGLPSLNLYYIRHWENIRSGYFLSLGDYINYQLCNVFSVHPTNCAGSGLMDLEGGGWNYEAINKMGCSTFDFPNLTNDFQPIGFCKTLDSTVFPAFGDQQTALLGSMLNDGELSLNIGTGSQVSMITNHLTFGDFQTRPFFCGEYLKTITHLPAGRALNILMEF